MGNILEYQRKVEESITSVGGYWRPLSGLARVMEEIGEVGELIHNNSSRGEINNELADVFIISTCLANQYCANLSLEYKKIGYSGNIIKLMEMIEVEDDILELYIKLVRQAGRLGRIVNHYDGDKRKKEGEENLILSKEIAELHIILFTMAKTLSIDIFESVTEVLVRNSKRDKGRFVTLYDPTTVSSLKRFENIVKSTHCIFATTAKIWSSPVFNQKFSIEENLKLSCEVLSRFNRCAEYEGLDGFVIEILGHEYGDSIQNLSKTVNKVLRYLSDNDPSAVNCMNENIIDPKWRFSFGGVTFFITTFAPCYPINHPRYSHNDGSTFIFLQPEFSFDHHGIHRENPKRESIKERVRENFKKNNSEYNVSLVQQNIEVYKYVKPIHKDEPPIAWWETRQLQHI